MVNLYHFKTLLLLKLLFLCPNLILSNQKIKLRTPIEDLESKTSSEIYTELKNNQWAETKVDSVEMCDKGKCPKLMNLCPDGGNCSVTGGCQGELCACRIEIKCTEFGQRASERGDDYNNYGEAWKGNTDKDDNGADYHLSESSDEKDHDYNKKRRGPTRYREKIVDESSEEDTSSQGYKEEQEVNEEKNTTGRQKSNKQSKEVRGPTRYREKIVDESSEEDTSSQGYKEEQEVNEEKKTTGRQKSNKQSKEVRGPTRYKEKSMDESNEEDNSSHGYKEEQEGNEEKQTTGRQKSNKQSKEVRGPTRYKEKSWDESSEEDTSTSNDKEYNNGEGKTENKKKEEENTTGSQHEGTEEDETEVIKGTTEDNIENEGENHMLHTEGKEEENDSENKSEHDEVNSSIESNDSDEKDRNKKEDKDLEYENDDAMTENDSENETKKKEGNKSDEENDRSKKENENIDGSEKVEGTYKDIETIKSTVDSKNTDEENSMKKEHTTEPNKDAEQENSNSMEKHNDDEKSSFEKERELIQLLGNSDNTSEEDTKNEEKLTEEEKRKTTDKISSDTDILAMGEKIAEEKYENGTRFKYCFDNVETCDESYAIERCFKIRDGNNCVQQKKGCKFRKKGKRCCLMYKCQLESKREEDEDEISPEEKDSIRTNDNQTIKTETTMNIDKDSQESNSEMQDTTTVEIDKYKDDTESETEEDEKQKQKGISEERERDKTTTISGTNEALKPFTDFSYEVNDDEHSESWFSKKNCNLFPWLTCKSVEHGPEETIDKMEKTTDSKTNDHEENNNKEDRVSETEEGTTKGHEDVSEENTRAETTPISETKKYDEYLDDLFDEGSEEEVVKDKKQDVNQNIDTTLTTIENEEDRENKSGEHGPNRYKVEDNSKEETDQIPAAESKKNMASSCTESFENKLDCKVNAQSWCRSQTCQNGYVGRCQYKSKQGACCRKYSCKKYKEKDPIHQMGKSVVGNLKSVKTIVHYRYQGDNNITNILRPHHCDKTTICPVLEDKGICADSNLACNTDFSCIENNCKCIVTTSCDGEEIQAMLKQKHIRELSLYGSTSLSINNKDKSKCKKSICESEISKESGNICKNNSVRFCTTQLSCKEKCSCWININCGGKGDDEVENYAELSTDKKVDKGEGNGKEEEDEKEEKDEKVGKARHGDYDNSDKAMILLPPHMYTEKLTLYIGRHANTNNSDKEWHHHAEDRCEKESKKFDIGYNEDRTSNSHVFCMETYCVCYVQYANCSGIRNMDKTKNNKDSNHDSTNLEAFSTQPTVNVNAESNVSEGESDESDTKSSFDDDEVEGVEEDKWDDERNFSDTDENYERYEEKDNRSKSEDIDSNILSDSEESDSENSREAEEGQDYYDNQIEVKGEEDSGFDLGSWEFNESTLNENGNDYALHNANKDDVFSPATQSESNIDRKLDIERPKTQRGVFDSIIHGLSQSTHGDFGEDYQDTGESLEISAAIAEETIGENNLSLDEKLLTRKTFYQAHIFPLHMLEKLKGGGESSTYMKSEKCTDEDMCPRVEFFCGERGGECHAEADCNDKTDEGCLCTLHVTCA